MPHAPVGSRTLLLRACVLALVTVAACHRSEIDVAATLPTDGGAGSGGIGAGDGGGYSLPEVNPGSTAPLTCAQRSCDAGTACPATQQCVAGVCFVAAACTSDDGCLSDSHCQAGFCIPYEDACVKGPAFDSSCLGGTTRTSMPPAPVAGAGCTFAFKGSLSTPLVADLDHDGKPEIIVNTYDDSDIRASRVMALHGDSCTPLWSAEVYVSSDLAVADLDGDGAPEIIGIEDDISGAPFPQIPIPDERLVILDSRGAVLARSPVQGKSIGWGHAPTVVDVDGKAPAEIAVRGRVYRFVPSTPAAIEVVWNHDLPIASAGDNDWVSSIPAASDLDGDGLPEILDQMKVFDGATGQDKTPPGLLPAAPIPCASDCDPRFFTAVADFNLDGHPDIAVLTADGLQIYDWTAKKPLASWLRTTASSRSGGPLLVADFDGDRAPEIGVADGRAYTAYSLKCGQQPLPAGCQAPGILWQIKIQDSSSATVGSTAFDLDGDGTLEIVLRDELYLRILGASDGRTLLVQSMTSGTGTEIPVVADANGDGRADIVVLSDQFQKGIVDSGPDPNTGAPFTGWTQGLFVLTNPKWAAARPLWNQHAYHVTNVNDDLTVPTHEPPVWKSVNSERRQRAVDPAPTAMPTTTPEADLTARVKAPTCSGAMFTMTGTVCNRGSAAQPAVVAASFYDGVPGQGGKLLCTARTTGPLAPGQCQDVSCQIPGGPPRMLDLYLHAGDDGTGGTLPGQCRAGNDLGVRPQTYCGPTVIN